VLRRHGVATADLEDACQEVFLVLFRRRDEFEQRSSVRTWLYGIARRVAAHVTRSERGRHRLFVEHSEHPEPGASADELELSPDRVRARAMLEAALVQLSEEQREVFILYELELLTVAEVASAVGIGESTALYRLHAARKQLAALMKRWQLTHASQAGGTLVRKEAP
jgi:RNA polymerase sigma-70 factor (ECF subfamily)